MNLEMCKKSAALKAVEFVRDGMVVGLGTGSTAKYAIEAFGKKVSSGDISIIGVPTSKRTAELAEKAGITLGTLEDYPKLDIDIDGTDEVDADFNLIKGGGGAHTNEKKVAKAAREFIVIADYTKVVEILGEKFPVPVEVIASEKESVEEILRELGGVPKLREGFLTDNGNIILDTRFEIQDPLSLEQQLSAISGVLDNGIFAARKPERVIVGYENEIKILER